MIPVLVAILALVSAIITTLGAIAIAKINTSVKAGRAETQAVHDEIRTNDGKRAGDYIEATAKELVAVRLAASTAEGVAMALAHRIADQKLRLDTMEVDVKTVGHLLGQHIADTAGHRTYGVDESKESA